MLSPQQPQTPETRNRFAVVLLPAAAIVVAACLAWANSFSGPFVFDDRPAVLTNPTLGRISTALVPPADGGTVSGRPLVNLSLALNRTISGTDVWSYHAFNLAVHLCTALLLFGVVRRALSSGALACVGSPGPAERLTWDEDAATPVAFSAALVWAVHPLQTSAVTYIVQRAESLMALCFLLTLYGFVRGTLARGREGREGGAFWLTVSVAACAAGMAGKEVMAAAPVVVLLFDRTFLSGTVRAAWRARSRYYAALGATWLLLAWLVFANGSRAGTAGLGTSVQPLDYALTQCAAIVHYLKLALWPTGFVFDHGTAVVTDLATVWPQAILVVMALVASCVAHLRRRPVGFFAFAFFLILAPSSSFIPIATQTVAEHRLYLPLAFVTTALAVAVYRWAGRRVWVVAIALAVPLASGTHLRNRDYETALALWSDTVAKRPDNARARVHLGNSLVQAGRPEEALAQFQAALQLRPNDSETHSNLATVLAALGRTEEALSHHERAIHIAPESFAARLNFANTLTRAKRASDAVVHFAAAERLGTLDAPSHYNYGVVLVQTRDFPAAIEQFRATVSQQPEHVGARVNLGNALLLVGRAQEAIEVYEEALRRSPADPQILKNLGHARASLRASPQ